MMLDLLQWQENILMSNSSAFFLFYLDLSYNAIIVYGSILFYIL